MVELVTTRDSVIAELERVLSSPVFEGAGRSRALLKFMVDETLAGRADRLKEYTIGSEVLDKGESFDPRTDPIVRAEVSRLRSRLERYYALEGQADPVIIALPKGSYVPQFLERAGPSLQTPPAAKATSPSTRRFLRFAAIAVLVVSAFVAGLLIPWRSRHETEPTVAQVDVALTSQGEIGGEVGTSVVLSADGTRVAFVVSGADGVPHLHLRHLDNPAEQELPGTEGARGPFFSPDGSWVGFWAASKVKKINVDGGSPVVLCDAPDLLGASWGEDGVIVAAFGGPKLFRISAAGGAPGVILDLSQQSEMPVWPQRVHGSNLVLFSERESLGPNQSKIEVLSLETGKRSVLITGGTFGRIFGGTYLAYVNQGTLFAVSFDAKKVEVRGSPVPVLNGVSYSSTFGYAELDFSETGDLVFRKHQSDSVSAQWINRSGIAGPMLSKPGSYVWPRLSPDGKRLALAVTESGEPSVSIYENETNNFTHIPSPLGPCLPIWTPNGRFLVLGCRQELMWVRSDGTGQPQVLLQGKAIRAPWSFSPDGSRLAYYELGASSGFDLWTVPVRVSESGLTAGTPEIFRKTPAFETYPTFSPDGRWIAYGSNESGIWEIYVRAFPDNGTDVRVSTSGGHIPFFSKSSRELFYRTADQRIMAATYTIEHGSFVVHSVRQWSPVRLADTGVISNLDFDSRHNRFLGLTTAAGANAYADHHVTFIFNFREIVRARVASSTR